MDIDAVIRIKTRDVLTEKQIESLGYEIRSRFGSIIITRRYAWDKENDVDNAVLEVVQQYDEDKGEFVTGDDATLYSVRVWSRYYGPGYERGPALEIFGLLYFLLGIEGVVDVWYGGDSSDALDKVSPQYVFDLLNHYMQHAHEPYQRAFDRDADGPMCCGRQMIRFGWGGNYKAWSCAACGTVIEEHDGIRTEKHGDN